MPFRFGEVFLFVCFAALLLVFMGRPRAGREPPRHGSEDDLVASVVEIAPAPEAKRQDQSASAEGADKIAEPTGRQANMVDRGTIYQCVEYRCGEKLETHVYQITSEGQRCSEVSIYSEPFEEVLAAPTIVTW